MFSVECTREKKRVTLHTKADHGNVDVYFISGPRFLIVIIIIAETHSQLHFTILLSSMRNDPISSSQQYGVLSSVEKKNVRRKQTEKLLKRGRVELCDVMKKKKKLLSEKSEERLEKKLISSAPPQQQSSTQLMPSIASLSAAPANKVLIFAAVTAARSEIYFFSTRSTLDIDKQPNSTHENGWGLWVLREDQRKPKYI